VGKKPVLKVWWDLIDDFVRNLLPSMMVKDLENRSAFGEITVSCRPYGGVFC